MSWSYDACFGGDELRQEGAHTEERMMVYPTVAEFRFTPLDPPLSAHIADRDEWVVTQMSSKDLKDRKGTKVHKLRHWGAGDIYVRIQPPAKQ